MGTLLEHAVSVGDLRWRCNPDRLGFESTDEVACCSDIIGQDRALAAIRLGLEISSPGYNIYVSGLTGTGKSTTIKQLLENIQHGTKELFDICYVHNFRAAELPRCLKLAAGSGTELKRRMGDVLKTLLEHIPQALESDAFAEQKKRAAEDLQKRRIALASELEKAIEKKGFKLLEVQYGPFTRPVILPVVDGKPVDLVQLSKLVDEGKVEKKAFEKIRKDHEKLMEQMEAFLKTTRELDAALSDTIAKLELEIVGPIVEHSLRQLYERFPQPVDRFTEDGSEGDDTPDSGRRSNRRDGRRRFIEFEVNVVVDNAGRKKTPVIIETAPSYSNLFGTIERASDGRGEYRTDFTMIHSGSLLRANGGFLVLSLTDVIVEPGVWPALKRVLKNKKITIQGFDSFLLMPVTALKPEPIEVDVKVVLIGDAESYQILYYYDEDFQKIFKVKADFDSEMPNTQENLTKYAQFIRNILDKEGLKRFHKSAVAAIAEEGVAMAGRQSKFTAKFSDIADVIREASYWAGKNGSDTVTAEHVEKAVAERIHRVNLIDEKLMEMITDGTILLDIDGKKIGQINGLTVLDTGDYSFGKPVRITVETSMGRAGIINIEREAEMSGKTYNKGSLILEGYLRRMFAQDKPLTMSASICFEQSYGGVDGDSASSTEIYGLLSSIANIPVRQDLAVTGSVNQKGEIQPIGGVNEKIQGFYDICRVMELTGEQGVIIPRRNVSDLMLRKDVVKSIEDGRFHIYAVDTIDEGIELLTGVPAGQRLPDGGFEKDSVNDRVDRRLADFAEHMKDYYDSGED
jgi:lon-related putative ATP-dependent protease